jgi:hypothetical protein
MEGELVQPTLYTSMKFWQCNFHVLLMIKYFLKLDSNGQVFQDAYIILLSNVAWATPFLVVKTE